MPSSVVKSFAEKSGKSVAEVEALWQKIKEQGMKKGMADERLWTYVTGTLKKILKVESMEDKMIEKYLLSEGKYEMNNLADANSYYKVIKPFDVWLLSGHKSRGTGQVAEPVYTKVIAKKDDEIHNLVGGLFFVSVIAHKGYTMKVGKPNWSPTDVFERGAGKKFQKFDMSKLMEIDKNSAIKVKYNS